MIFLLQEDDQPQLSELEVAWLSLDFDKMQEFADELKEKPENELFKVLNDINTGKRERNVSLVENYSKFFIDNNLSNFADCIHSTYMANMLLHGLSNQAHYNYMIHSIPYGKRFSKASKLTVDIKEEFLVKLIMKFYDINKYDALMYLKIMNEKNTLQTFLQDARGMVTDDFLKSITKNVKEQKELKKLL